MAARLAPALGEWRGALRGLPRNPLLQRELRGWRRRAQDWRLWIGLRLPRDVREWGLPAVVWFSVAPYVVWLSVTAMRRLAPQLPQADTVSVFGAVIVALVLYACLVAAMAAAGAVVGERQQGTWEPLLATPLSAAELTLGCLIGRAGPIVFGVLVAILAWAVAQPNYTALFGPAGGPAVPPGDFALFAAAMLVRLVTLAAMGLAVSTRTRHTSSATAIAVALALALLAADVMAMTWLENAGSPALRAPLFLGGSAVLTASALEVARRGMRQVE